MWSGDLNFGQGQGKEYDCTVGLNILYKRPQYFGLLFCCWSGSNLGILCTPVSRWEPFPNRTEVIYVGANFRIPHVSIPVSFFVSVAWKLISLFVPGLYKSSLKMANAKRWRRLKQTWASPWNLLTMELSSQPHFPSRASFKCLLKPSFFLL